jgi:hypothetical protein
MAMAAMIRMIATTISNSIREKPFCFFMMLDLLEKFYGARARHTYRKPGTNAKAEAISRSCFRILQITKRIVEINRLISDASLPQNGQNPLKMTFFVHSKKHKLSTNQGQRPSDGCS